MWNSFSSICRLLIVFFFKILDSLCENHEPKEKKGNVAYKMLPDITKYYIKIHETTNYLNVLQRISNTISTLKYLIQLFFRLQNCHYRMNHKSIVLLLNCLDDFQYFRQVRHLKFLKIQFFYFL